MEAARGVAAAAAAAAAMAAFVESLISLQVLLKRFLSLLVLFLPGVGKKYTIGFGW